MTPSPSPTNPPIVIEWKPQGVEMDAESPQTQGAVSEDMDNPQGDLKAIYGSTVTVTIDPPRDNGGGVDAEVSDYLGGGRGEVEASVGAKSLLDLFGNQDNSEEDFDLFESLNEMDVVEEDESEPVAPTKICLMSK
jgi:hypothetical protein